eukprot:jgi/Bigna1/141943/aug1.66_g16651
MIPQSHHTLQSHRCYRHIRTRYQGLFWAFFLGCSGILLVFGSNEHFATRANEHRISASAPSVSSIIDPNQKDQLLQKITPVKDAGGEIEADHHRLASMYTGRAWNPNANQLHRLCIATESLAFQLVVSAATTMVTAATTTTPVASPPPATCRPVQEYSSENDVGGIPGFITAKKLYLQQKALRGGGATIVPHRTQVGEGSAAATQFSRHCHHGYHQKQQQQHQDQRQHHCWGVRIQIFPTIGRRTGRVLTDVVELQPRRSLQQPMPQCERKDISISVNTDDKTKHSPSQSAIDKGGTWTLGSYYSRTMALDVACIVQTLLVGPITSSRSSSLREATLHLTRQLLEGGGAEEGSMNSDGGANRIDGGSGGTFVPRTDHPSSPSFLFDSAFYQHLKTVEQLGFSKLADMYYDALAAIREGLTHATKRIQQLLALQRTLNLTRIPRTIEAYDISHCQGYGTVASKIVLKDGIPATHRYRCFKVLSEGEGRGTGPPCPPLQPAMHSDDCKSMQEAVFKRFSRRRWKGRRLHDDEGRNEERDELGGGSDYYNSDSQKVKEGEWEDDELPDLVLIDGGKPQLGAAIKGLNAARIRVGIDVDVAALAKREEQLFVLGTKTPVPTKGRESSDILLCNYLFF